MSAGLIVFARAVAELSATKAAAKSIDLTEIVFIPSPCDEDDARRGFSVRPDESREHANKYRFEFVAVNISPTTF